MMRSCEGIGKNVEQAINNALLELKASRDDVDIKILSEGGFLKKARVVVSISEDALDKYEMKDKLKQALSDEGNDEDFAENFIKNKISLAKNEEKDIPEENLTQENSEILTETVEETEDDEENVVSEEQNEEIEEKVERKKMKAEDFVNGLLKSLDLQGEIQKSENDRVEIYNVTGENVNKLIGYHGDCLNALSHIMSLTCCGENKKHVVLDVEGYRKKREKTLQELAKRIADKVAKTKRYHKFEPMEPRERRIIHLALQNDDRVTTISKGDEPHRYLMVFPKEYDE